MKTMVIKGGRLIDGHGGAPVQDSVLILEGERIVAVRTAAETKIPGGDDVTLMDATGKTVMPGLIDGHIHIYMDGESTGFFELPIHNNSIDMAMKAIPRLRRTLEMGFTTVRDGGSGYSWFEVSLREAIKRGDIVGPRYLTSGYHLTVTGGHGYFLPHWLGRFEPPEQLGMHCDGVDAWRKGARLNLYNGTDNIKVVASRGFASLALRGAGPPTCAQATVEEMQAAVSEAHKMGRKAMAHANGPEAVKNAVRAGVDSIVHGLHVDEEAVRMIVNAIVVLEPTNICFRPDRYEGTGIEPPQPGSKQHAMKTRTIEEFHMILEKGVTISCGSDASVPYLRNGDNARELAACVDLGMTPMEAIVSATKTAATTLGLGDKVGTIEKGKLADILIVDGDPLADIGVLTREACIACVIKNGEIAIHR